MTVAILGSIPVIGVGVAQIATTGIAGAKAAETCSGTGTGQVVTFASPGLSNQGTASPSAASKSKTGGGTVSCKGLVKGTGTVTKNKIKSVSTTQCSTDSNPPSPCPTSPTDDFVYDSSAQFMSGSSTLYKDIKNQSWKVGATTFAVAAFTASSSIEPGGTCGGSEAGFLLSGPLTTGPSSLHGKTVTINACLGTDTGPGTSGSFLADFLAEQGGNTSIIITTATLDPATTTIKIA
jgi:hypothetical protein